jgi:adenine/guanine phosphoribosyltransferase-like PRPP-binding protein
MKVVFMKILKNVLKNELNIRTEKDFPIEGIEFIDITPLILQKETLKEMIDAFEASFSKKAFTKVSSKPSYKNSDTYFIDRSTSTLYFNLKNSKN